MATKPPSSTDAAKTRRQAESRLRTRQKDQRLEPAGGRVSEGNARRLLHELQVHQVELEMQNDELQAARDKMTVLVDRYTKLYDFAPVGYFTLDPQARIQEVNLTGAALLGISRSSLVGRRFQDFVVPASRSVFLSFLARVLAAAGKQSCELSLLNRDGLVVPADLQGTSTATDSAKKSCQLAVSDISASRRAEEAQRSVEALASTNQELRQEIVRRQAVEEALRKSEKHTSQLLAEAHQLQSRLRDLSRRILSAQDEERKRISRELHDVIAQTLTSINVRLATLKTGQVVSPQDISTQILDAQRLVEQSVDIVHRFSRELRPPVLDDLGLVPALHAFLKGFTRETGVRVSLAVCAGVERLNEASRTTFYRVAQEALHNVARHAEATRVEVSLRRLGGGLCLTVHDNGKSFDVATALYGKGNARLGLLGMRERVEMIGGEFSMKSDPAHGTTLQALVPLPNRRKPVQGKTRR